MPRVGCRFLLFGAVLFGLPSFSSAVDGWLDSQSPLGAALIAGDLESVRQHIESDSNLNARIDSEHDPSNKKKHGLPLLGVPIAYDNFDIALDKPIGKDNHKIVQYLLQKGADPNIRLSQEEDVSILWYAMCRLRGYRAALVLIDFGAQIDEVVDRCSGNILHKTVQAVSGIKLQTRYDEEKVRRVRSVVITLLQRLLDHGVDPDYRSAIDGAGTPLVEAVLFREREIINLLLQYGAGASTPSGLAKITPLNAAFMTLDDQPVDPVIVHRLLDAGADPRLDPKPEFIAERLTDVDAQTARRLFEHHLDPNLGNGLSNAIQYSRADLVREFIRAGVDLNSYRDKPLGTLPLVKAVQFKKWEIVDLLIEAGADPNVDSHMPGVTVRQILTSESRLK